MKEAFKKGSFSYLQNLVKDQNGEESLYYKGIMAENGLGQEVDLSEAKTAYQASFDKHNLKSGLALARIYYEEGNFEEAKKIFAEILDIGMERNSPEDELTTGYAAYRLARLNPKKNQEQMEDVINTYDSFLDLLKKEKLTENPLYAKVLYHKADNLIKFYAPKGFSNNMLKDIKNILQESAKKYPKAKAELQNIEAQIILQDHEDKHQEYNKKLSKEKNRTLENEILDKKLSQNIISLLDKALVIDPGNINARMLKFETYQKSDAHDKDSKSLEVIREVLVIDPHNQLARNRLAELKNRFLRDVQVGVAEEIYKITKIKKDPKNIIPELSANISENLTDLDYINNIANFDKKAGKNIAKQIAIAILPCMEKIKDNINENIYLKEDVKTRAKEEIQKWDEEQIKLHSTGLSEDDQKLLKKRQDFKERLLEHLEQFYTECSAISKPGSRLKFTLPNEGTNEVINSAIAVGTSAVGGAIGSSAVASIGPIYDAFCKCQNEAERTAKKNAAMKFAEIGKSDGKNSSKIASEYLNNLADDIIEKYGMQIDYVKEGKDIEALADMAAKKMLSHYTDATRFREIKEYFNIEKITSFFIKYNKGKDNFEKDVSQNLLDGIEKTLPEEDKKINTISLEKGSQSRTWNLSDIFCKPLITSNGAQFYKTKESDIDYGVSFDKHLALKKDKNIGTEELTREQENFKRHMKLLSYKDFALKTEKKPEEFIASKITPKDKSKLRANSLLGRIETIFGGYLLAGSLLGSMFMVIGAIAAPSLSIGIVITVFAIGFTSLSDGVYRSSVANNSLSDIEEMEKNSKILIKEQEKAEPTKSKEASLSREKEFMQKFEENNIYKIYESAQNNWTKAFDKTTKATNAFWRFLG